MSAQKDLEKLEREMRGTLCHVEPDRVVSEWADRIAAIREGLGKAHEEQAWIERKVYKNSAEHSAYLTARFTPQAGRNGISFEYDGHRWSYKWTSFDDAGDYDLLVRPNSAPPADSAQVLVEALEKIARVNAMDYEYRRWAREALAAHKSEGKG